MNADEQIDAVDKLILYQSKSPIPLGFHVLITRKSVIKCGNPGKEVPISDVKRIYWEKWEIGPRMYILFCDYSVAFFFKSWFGLYAAKSIDDGMTFSEDDQKEIDKIFRAIDIAKLT
jgi:hypothetical protein